MDKEIEKKVIVTDINMSFSSMVGFMVKGVLASIPALIILVMIGIISNFAIINIISYFSNYGG